MTFPVTLSGRKLLRRSGLPGTRFATHLHRRGPLPVRRRHHHIRRSVGVLERVIAEWPIHESTLKTVTALRVHLCRFSKRTYLWLTLLQSHPCLMYGLALSDLDRLLEDFPQEQIHVHGHIQKQMKLYGDSTDATLEARLNAGMNSSQSAADSRHSSVSYVQDQLERLESRLEEVFRVQRANARSASFSPAPTMPPVPENVPSSTSTSSAGPKNRKSSALDSSPNPSQAHASAPPRQPPAPAPKEGERLDSDDDTAPNSPTGAGQQGVGPGTLTHAGTDLRAEKLARRKSSKLVSSK